MFSLPLSTIIHRYAICTWYKIARQCVSDISYPVQGYRDTVFDLSILRLSLTLLQKNCTRKI